MRSRLNNFHLLISIIVVIILQAGPIKALGQEEEKIQKAKEYFSLGKEFIRQGNYTAANDEFKKAQQLLGTAPPATSSKTESAAPSASLPAAEAKEGFKIKESKDAISYYLKAIKLQPKNIALHYNLALEHIKRNEFKQAEEEFKLIIELDPNDKDAC